MYAINSKTGVKENVTTIKMIETERTENEIYSAKHQRVPNHSNTSELHKVQNRASSPPPCSSAVASCFRQSS